MGFGDGLDGVADIAQCNARFYRFDPGHHRVICNVDQLLCLDRNFVAENVHPAGIAVPAIDDDSDVDIRDIAIQNFLRSGNTVAYDMVDRNAAGLGIALVPQRRRDGAMLDGVVMDQLIQLFRRNAGNAERRDIVQQLGGQFPGLAHTREGRRGMKFNPVLIKNFFHLAGGIVWHLNLDYFLISVLRTMT